MECLFCHDKIPRWRRLKTGSQFCCDEHAEQHKSEMVNRLLEYSDTRVGHAAEDPIHRLALMGSETPIDERPAPKWQLVSFTTLEMRRYAPTIATRLAPPQDFLISCQPQRALAAPALSLWQKAVGPGRPRSSERPERRTTLPLAGLAEPVWIDPRLLDPGISIGLIPAAHELALSPALGAPPKLALRPLSPIVPIGLLTGTSLLYVDFESAIRARTARLPGSLRPAAPLSCWAPQASAAQAVAAARHSAAALQGAGRTLGGVQATGQFLPMMAQAAPAGTPDSAAGAGLQSVVASACQVVPVTFEAVALAPAGKRPAGFRDVSSDLRDFAVQPWRTAASALWRDHGTPVEWSPALPESRKVGSLPRVSRPGVLPYSTLLSIAAPAPAMRVVAGAPMPHDLVPELRQGTAPAYLDAALPHVRLRCALRAAALLIPECAPAVAAASALNSPLDPQIPDGAARLLPRTPAGFLSFGAKLRMSGPLDIPPVAAGSRDRALAAAGLLRPGPSAPVVYSRLTPHSTATSPAAAPREAASWCLAADLAAWQPVPPSEWRPAATALRLDLEPAKPPSHAHLPPRSALQALPAACSLSASAAALLPALQVDAGTVVALPHSPEVHAPETAPRLSSRLRSAATQGNQPDCAEWRDIEARPVASAAAAPFRIESEPLPPGISPVLRGLASLPPGAIPLAGTPIGASAKFAAPTPLRPQAQPLAPAATARSSAPAALPTGAVAPAALLHIEPRAKLQPASPLCRLAAVAPEAALFEAPAPAPRAMPMARVEDESQATPAVDGVREALEEAELQRDNYHRRLAQSAVFAWYEVIKPELSTQRGRRILAALGILIFVPVSLHVAHSSTALASLARPLLDRSYFLLEERFEAGSKDWTNPAALTSGPDGLAEVKDGITLYQPSLNLTDYDFTFAGKIRRASLGWTVRATDPKNFYAFKLTRTGKGKDRRVVLVRYAVLNGVPEKPQVLAVPFDVEENRLYHITVRATADRITTVIDDRGVDSFSDSRLKAGGIGFFAETGETGLIHALSVSGNDDSEGRAIYGLANFWRSVTGIF